MPDPCSAGTGSLGSSSQGDSPAGLEAVAPCLQGFISFMPVCPLDNAHLCESLYSTAQEQYIVIQGLRHHNLVPWQQEGCHKRLGIPEVGWGEPSPRQSRREWEAQDKGSRHCYLQQECRLRTASDSPQSVKLCSAICGLCDILQVTQLL